MIPCGYSTVNAVRDKEKNHTMAFVVALSYDYVRALFPFLAFPFLTFLSSVIVYRSIVQNYAGPQ